MVITDCSNWRFQTDFGDVEQALMPEKLSAHGGILSSEMSEGGKRSCSRALSVSMQCVDMEAVIHQCAKVQTTQKRICRKSATHAYMV